MSWVVSKCAQGSWGSSGWCAEKRWISSYISIEYQLLSQRYSIHCSIKLSLLAHTSCLLCLYMAFAQVLSSQFLLTMSTPLFTGVQYSPHGPSNFACYSFVYILYVCFFFFLFLHTFWIFISLLSGKYLVFLIASFTFILFHFLTFNFSYLFTFTFTVIDIFIVTLIVVYFRVSFVPKYFHHRLQVMWVITESSLLFSNETVVTFQIHIALKKLCSLDLSRKETTSFTTSSTFFFVWHFQLLE